MRRYDDLVDVRRGRVAGAGGTGPTVEGPEQFLWKGRLWKVSVVVAHWVETGAWWQSGGVHAVLGVDHRTGDSTGDSNGDSNGDLTGGWTDSDSTAPADLSAEREVWRVEADRGMSSAQLAGTVRGVFDLVFDWADGSWRLIRCLD